MTTENMLQRNSGVSSPRVMFCGVHKGVGVSTVVFGLVVALSRKQVSVSCATFGVSLIEPTHYRRLANRLCYTLDPLLLSSTDVLSGIRRTSEGSEISLFDGSGGLFDERDSIAGLKTQADIAVASQTPIILVIDGEQYGESVAAVIAGFCDYRPELSIKGVIFNRVVSKEQNARFEQIVTKQGRVEFLGGIRVGDPHQMGATLAAYRSHNPSALTRNRVIGTGNLIQESLRIDVLQNIAQAAPQLSSDIVCPPFDSRKVRIAVADDQAFHLTLQDNLDLLRRAGAELVPFSPIADHSLPKNCGAVYFPGGYPHLYAKDLESNLGIRRSLSAFIESGGALYAEAGALAYFARRLITFQGVAHEMVGLFPAQATAICADEICSPLVVETLYGVRDGLLVDENTSVKSLRDSRWTFRLDSHVVHCLERDGGERVLEQEKVRTPEAFIPTENMFFSRCYLHWVSCPSIVSRFVQKASRISSSPK